MHLPRSVTDVIVDGLLAAGHLDDIDKGVLTPRMRKWSCSTFYIHKVHELCPHHGLRLVAKNGRKLEADTISSGTFETSS